MYIIIVRNLIAFLAIGMLLGACGNAPKKPSQSFIAEAAADTQEADKTGFCAGAKKGTSDGMTVNVKVTHVDQTGTETTYRRVGADKEIKCPKDE